MPDNLDTQSLLALDAARTPGEWTTDGVYVNMGEEQIVITAWTEHDARAIVAAVNALGPLCRRVRELEAELEKR